MSPLARNRPVIELPLRAAAASAHKLLLALCVGIPWLATIGVLAFGLIENPRTPPPLLFGASVAALVAPLLVTLPLAWLLQRAMHRNRGWIEADTLAINSSFYRQRIALGDLDLAAARVLSLDEHREWRPLFKTNGFALPGYRSGHFRLRNRKKAFCAVAGDGRIVMIPRRNGSVLLLGLRLPEQALTQLREACGHA